MERRSRWGVRNSCGAVISVNMAIAPGSEEVTRDW
jgi:hypothetical protein